MLMARPSDLNGDVSRALEETPEAKRRREYHAARRQEALTLRLAGMSWSQIAERMQISVDGAKDMVNRTLERAENRKVEELRDLENARLDRAQAAIWTKVLNGDLKAINAFLQISKQRAALNGLNAPQRLDVNLAIKHEMEKALAELEELVLEGEVVEETRALEAGDEHPES